jgi:hypothetical protein
MSTLAAACNQPFAVLCESLRHGRRVAVTLSDQILERCWSYIGLIGLQIRLEGSLLDLRGRKLGVELAVGAFDVSCHGRYL